MRICPACQEQLLVKVSRNTAALQESNVLGWGAECEHSPQWNDNQPCCHYFWPSPFEKPPMKEFKWLKRSADLKSNSAEGCPLKYLCTSCFQSRKICIKKKKIKILQKLRRKGHYFLTNLSFWVTGSFHFCGNVFQNSDEFFFLRKLIVQGLSSTELESSQ